MRYVSINGDTLRRNTRNGTNNPPIRIAKSKSDTNPVYAHEIRIKGNAELVYRHDKPMRRGDVMVCIRSVGCPALTLGKRYVVLAYSPALDIRIRNDEGKLRYYPSVRFEHRHRVKRADSLQWKD